MSGRAAPRRRNVETDCATASQRRVDDEGRESRTHERLQSRRRAVLLEKGLEDEGQDEPSCGGPGEADAVREPATLDEPFL